ncbi:unnamed protein product [Calicophoron daubneyi]|uniref:Uncharacterized protein n=1 Tax=Calicophoron daubneyi TaxID=300641 RepID=A0AAV2THM8_CALDB
MEMQGACVFNERMQATPWEFVVPLYPVHFKQVTQAVLKYVSGYKNKFVSDLNALLINYERKSLRILTSIEPSSLGLPSNKTIVVPIRPELNSLQIRAQINVHVFTPRIGIELTATVCAIQPHLVLCNTEIPNVTITLSRCAETGACVISTSGPKADAEPESLILNLNDTVCVRLSAVSKHPSLLILRGELVRVISRSKSKGTLKKCDESGVTKQEATAEDELEPKKKKRLKISSPTATAQMELAVDDNMIKPEADHVTRRKRSPSSDTNTILSVQIKSEPTDSPPRKKHKPVEEDNSLVLFTDDEQSEHKSSLSSQECDAVEITAVRPSKKPKKSKRLE